MVKLRIADNTEVKCPVANVIIKTGNNTYQIEAAIVRQLLANVAPWQGCVAWERCSLARIQPGMHGDRRNQADLTENAAERST